jgi:hypothetical protein
MERLTPGFSLSAMFRTAALQRAAFDVPASAAPSHLPNRFRFVKPEAARLPHVLVFLLQRNQMVSIIKEGKMFFPRLFQPQEDADMVRNIVIILILAVIGVPSWQVGMITLQKKKVGYVVQEQANKIKKYDNEELIRQHLTKELELLGLPTQFKMERPEHFKLKITYNYMASASVFGKTYYEVAETIEKVTEEGAFDRGK